ncbi:hypothetical protein EYV94_08070 [Puteibacter caeruleilacunae]|nr:hypothetical protein EYV94_08070 [Puteibacter caeruleilacunae]
MMQLMPCKEEEMPKQSIHQKLGNGDMATLYQRTVLISEMLLHEIIKPIWNTITPNGRGIQAFLDQNIGCWGLDGFLEDCSNLRVSNGTIPFPTDFGFEDQGHSHVCFCWGEDPELDPERPDDELCFVAICNGMMYMSLETEIPRSDGDVTIQLPFKKGDEVDMYIFFSNEDHTDFSISLHEFMILE